MACSQEVQESRPAIAAPAKATTGWGTCMCFLLVQVGSMTFLAWMLKPFQTQANLNQQSLKKPDHIVWCSPTPKHPPPHPFPSPLTANKRPTIKHQPPTTNYQPPTPTSNPATNHKSRRPYANIEQSSLDIAAHRFQNESSLSIATTLAWKASSTRCTGSLNLSNEMLCRDIARHECPQVVSGFQPIDWASAFQIYSDISCIILYHSIQFIVNLPSFRKRRGSPFASWTFLKYHFGGPNIGLKSRQAEGRRFGEDWSSDA